MDAGYADAITSQPRGGMKWLVIGIVWLMAGAIFAWFWGGAAKLGGPEDKR